MAGNSMTYPRPRESKRAITIAYFIVGTAAILFAIGAFFFAREIRDESEIPPAGTGQSATESPVGTDGRELGAANSPQ
jgi:hypothetical protein